MKYRKALLSSILTFFLVFAFVLPAQAVPKAYWATCLTGGPTWDKTEETPAIVEQVLKLGRSQNKRGVNPAALFSGYGN